MVPLSYMRRGLYVLSKYCHSGATVHPELVIKPQM